MTSQTFMTLQDRIAQSEFGQAFSQNPLLAKDTWPFTDLGYTPEQLNSVGNKNLYFISFQLPWLKLLAQLTLLSLSAQKRSPDSVRKCLSILRHLDSFLVEQGYSQTSELTAHLLQKFIAQGINSVKQERQRYISYATQLWKEEDWLKINLELVRYSWPTPKIEVIPEEVLVQIYENFDLFPSPLERLFRLQFVFGCRIGEILVLPRQCLKLENEKWFIKRWIEKRKTWKFYPIHSLVVELIKEQQHFLNKQFGVDSEFDKLFCWMSSSPSDGAKQSHRNATRFDIEPIYQPKLFNQKSISSWLRAFSKVANLQDKHGNQFMLTSHMFRRTKASIMAYCEAEDEYIATVMGHASLDMLPHYRKRSLERLQKEAQAKGYVDMYGRETTFKPKKQRYEQLANLMKVSTPLGECHRPKMLGDCQYRYACLRCDHHRVTSEDRQKLEDDLASLQVDLQQAQTMGADRRVTEITELTKLIENRLHGLNKLSN
jgi:integrase